LRRSNKRSRHRHVQPVERRKFSVHPAHPLEQKPTVFHGQGGRRLAKIDAHPALYPADQETFGGDDEKQIEGSRTEKDAR